MKNLKVVFSVPENILTSVNERLAVCNNTDGDSNYDVVMNEIIRDELDKFIMDDNSSFMKEVIPQVSDLAQYEFFRNEFMKSIESTIDKTLPKNGRGKRIRHGRHAKTK